MSTAITSRMSIDGKAVAWMNGTNTKVVEVVLLKLAYGWSPEEIQLNLLHLSLAQIYAAFAYYYENKAHVDAQIEAERLRQ